MEIIKVMVNGLPGNVSAVVARHVLEAEGFELLPYSLTGPEHDIRTFPVGGLDVELIQKDGRENRLQSIRESEGDFISVDYTHPSAVVENAEIYCRLGLPFVMGTTGGDRDRLEQTAAGGAVPAVIAPNMAKQIVGFQAMMAYAAERFPNLFKGYRLEIRESHQQGKADTSGTAKAMVRYFNALGIDFEERRIVRERDPDRQRREWGIAPEYLSGHGWHTYTLVSPDGTVRFEFTHNVNGREIYGSGTLDAIRFLQGRIREGAAPRVYNMIDVLQGG